MNIQAGASLRPEPCRGVRTSLVVSAIRLYLATPPGVTVDGTEAGWTIKVVNQ